jgi:hypothetical protein
MNKKIVGIFIIMLLIAAALPAVGIMNIGHTTKTEPNDPQPAATKTSYLSIPAAAFRPVQDGYDFENQGYKLQNNDGPSFLYFAPVELPHDATIVNIKFFWHDYSTNDGEVVLMRSYLFTDTQSDMAHIYSQGSNGYGVTETNSINDATIDNRYNSYYMGCYLPDISVLLSAVVFEYTYESGSVPEGTFNDEESQVVSNLVSK